MIDGSVQALIVEDDILVAAFIEGVLLDRDIAADSIMVSNCRKYVRLKPYDVAVVGIDGGSVDLSTVVHLLQRSGIPTVFFSIRGDPRGLTGAFPQISICRYDGQCGKSLALIVLDAAKRPLIATFATPV